MKEDIRETRLDNGIVVLTDRMQGLRSATIGFFYRAGSRNEPDELNGITHFIEHAVFKGSENRTAMDIAVEQDRLGGNLDAFTTHEETGFAMKVIDDQIVPAFDLLSDMLTCPRFDQADCLNEQRVIIEEIKMNEDSPEEMLGDIFQREFFPRHPMGLSITGTPETVRTFGNESVSRYHRKAFAPHNLVIAAAGNVEHERIVDLVRSSIPTGAWDESGLLPAVRRPNPAAPIHIERRDDLEQAHVIIATPIVSARDPRRYAADLLVNVLGGGTSSRLWQKVREERGLAYSVGASAAMYLDTGFMMVSAATSPEQAGEVLDIVVDELGGVARSGFSREELDLVKDQTRASILLGLEDSAGRAASLAQCEMVHGRQIPVEETLEKLASVSIDEVHDVAREFFCTENLAFVALGDLDGLHVTRERLAL